MYSIEPFQLTQKTTVYNVQRGSLFVAQFGRQSAAGNFARYLNDNDIQTRQQWQQQPHRVKLAFIMASCQYEPNL